jgi:hypothetical protein
MQRYGYIIRNNTRINFRLCVRQPRMLLAYVRNHSPIVNVSAHVSKLGQWRAKNPTHIYFYFSAMSKHTLIWHYIMYMYIIAKLIYLRYAQFVPYQ